jgi:hypothetical protein
MPPDADADADSAAAAADAAVTSDDPAATAVLSGDPAASWALDVTVSSRSAARPVTATVFSGRVPVPVPSRRSIAHPMPMIRTAATAANVVASVRVE